jgi:hypothetical protein
MKDKQTKMMKETGSGKNAFLVRHLHANAVNKPFFPDSSPSHLLADVTDAVSSKIPSLPATK